ncbi:MAG: hypothetical protein FWF68_00160 [Spirochaetes bacterium]|nr:hypothetical protein [Brevinematales bacterium]MCL1957990.1 hypothetical protein [Spirochaetota bacterium]
MVKKPVFLFFVLILAMPAYLAAQDGFLPAVTHIRAETRNKLIRLTWTDSPDARGPVYIFRSARPFSGSVPANVRPVVVRYGAQFYIDDTDGMENIYYFIAASDVSGRRYDIIIPQINSIIVNIVSPGEPVYVSPSVTEEWNAQGIFNLRARNDGERVVITFNTTNMQKRAVLYRSAQPIIKNEDLLNAVVVRSGIRSPFTDMPAPETAWYYTVIYEDEISNGNINIKPGVNSTASPVFAYGEETAYSFIRPIPLPILTLDDFGTGGFLPHTSRELPLSNEAANIAGSVRPLHNEPLIFKKPRVFAIDMEAPAGGEEAALAQIIKEFFGKFDWEGASMNLQQYLSLPRSKDVQMRASFYFAQTLYYTGRYSEALMEFLSFRSVNSVEANSWIDAVLSAMVY